MFKKLFTITFSLVILLSVFLSAQDHLILRPNGKIIKHRGNLSRFEIRPNKLNKNQAQNVTQSVLGKPSSTLNTVDTLRMPGPPWASNQFVLYSQDVMVQWFVCPADLILKKVGVACYANDPGGNIEVKVVKVNWAYEDILNAPVELHGYYEATGNGWNDITAFQDNPDITGGWVSLDGGLPEPFGEDLWSDGGVGLNFTPTPDTDPNTYDWVDLSLIQEPVLNRGDIFGVVLKNANVEHGDADGPTTEYNDFNIGGWKFYAEGRNTDEDYGWWSREYSWNYVAEVELTGDRPPVFVNFTTPGSGLDTGPFTVDAEITDDNPGDPATAGVASAMIFYSTDGTTYDSVAMTGSEPNFTGQIPAQSPNTTVDWYLQATDVGGLTSQTVIQEFYVFGPTGKPTLLVFNGYEAISGYPQSYYFGNNYPNTPYTVTAFDRDRWSYGDLTPELVNNYQNIIEIATNGPNSDNSQVISGWLAADGTRNYMLAGDEWMGAVGWGWDSTRHIPDGDFLRDVLGVAVYYPDVNYGASGDQALPSIVFPQMGTTLGGALYDRFTKVVTDSAWTDSLHYDPWLEITVSNWLDGAEFVDGVEVFMKALGADGSIYDIAGNRTLPAGNKIAFLTYDPVSLDIYDGADKYYWFGFTKDAPQVKVLEWFGIITDVKTIDNLVPAKFDLTQNYPNPFNPSTSIRFSIPQTSKVLLKVYDVLGREVATLVNSEKAAGNYEVNFDASKLASGLYVYTINAGNYSATKKMMLLK